MYTRILTLLFLSAVVYTAKEANDAENLRKILEDLKKCIISTEITQGELQKLLLYWNRPTKTHHQKCFLTCIYNTFGLLKDGRLDKNVSKTLAEAWLGKNNDHFVEIKIVIDICAVRVHANETDPCEIGETLKTCFIQQKLAAKNMAFLSNHSD